ncbi:hypothetical protein M8C21_027701, partial [Ambrosia artemisiifolia]
QMASRQDPRAKDDVKAKELRAEEAARTAADELHDINKKRDENRPGIIGSIFQSVTGTLGAVTGKTHEATEKAKIVSTETAERERQNKQDAARKAGEYKDYTAQKAGEAADKTARKAGECKDYTAQKASEAADKTGEYKDYTAQKAKETAQKTKETAREAKDYTVDKAKEAKDATMGKMDEYKDHTADKAKETKDYTVDKSTQGKESGVGKLSELKDKAMDFFTRKHETDEEAKRKLETMHLKDQGYDAKGTRMDTTSASATVTKADPLKATAETFRKADQMSGQAFNDVGGMDEDDSAKGVKGGVYRVQLKHEKK